MENVKDRIVEIKNEINKVFSTFRTDKDLISGVQFGDEYALGDMELRMDTLTELMDDKRFYQKIEKATRTQKTLDLWLEEEVKDLQNTVKKWKKQITSNSEEWI